MDHLLWRLANISAAPHAPERLAEGLALHLQHTELVSLLAQIGQVQQAYISALGCSGCHLGRHVPGCYVELLRRLLAATFETVKVVPIHQGLARRPYSQVVLARPDKDSLPFDGADLAAWEEARLVLHWQQGVRGLTTAALLAVGDGPDPASFFQGCGWSARPLPAGIGRLLGGNPVPTAVWFRQPWPGEPFLLTPQGAPLDELASAEVPPRELAAGAE